MDKKKTLVLGASANPARYSNLAVNRLVTKGYPVLAIGRKKASVAGINISIEKENYKGVHTVSIYLNPNHQKDYYDYILGLQPERIIFNPGAENDELMQLAGKKGIKTLYACTLVMLSAGSY